ncbi:hypothetical protein [Dactylosporangium matsuzakiense]|uniref:Uncharacterized protein n=1 Tax=Dactylosporangium matsuzakiense TaxID=53360 RepID=A0A9W6NSA1_9ACTN|nr:hypothetical protein [Dactylosporangium matsuzakiense]UWZ45439.1 hypothetical protein Dmats_02510 [Dactylosporangium matsuzakiense]GLL08140.1 hypothetical protein GCM10017581_099000 [Dactylosporangium matsuzakiense]
MRGDLMGKSKKNGNFDSQGIERGMHRSEDDLGYLDQDLTDDMTITPDSIMSGDIMSGETTNANTVTMRARTKTQQEQTAMQKKRGNQPDM